MTTEVWEVMSGVLRTKYEQDLLIQMIDGISGVLLNLNAL